MTDRVTLFAEVIVPMAVPNYYTYRIPYQWNEEVKPGMRVVVQFGKSKRYSAIVRRVHEQAPAYTAKYIEEILDSTPIVTETQLQLWDWMASYYLCTRGEVMLAALPSGLRLSSETRLIRNPEFQGDTKELDDEAFLLFEALEIRNVLSIDDAQAILEKKSVLPVIRRLLESGALVIQEEIREKFKPRIETFVRLSDHADQEENLKTIFDQLEKRAFKQLELLMAFVTVSDRYGKRRPVIRKNELMKSRGASEGAFKGLLEKNILVAEDHETSWLEKNDTRAQSKPLSAHQEKAYDEIQTFFKAGKEAVLLYGVTASGKTEIYIRLIEEQLKAGKQCLYLLPEIALTTQIITRLQKHFGDRVLIYHSRYSENERVETWKQVRTGKPFVILGARSAVFLPFENLGFIVVDEEHDSSYKQFDPAPRYNARETALYLARLHKAHTLLGSATPSLESWFNAEEKRYGLVSMTERFGGVQLPEIQVVDIKELARRKMMKSHFSPQLLEKIGDALKEKQQVILFQNRRGFAPSIECADCAHVPQCTRCDVSLTYHKQSDQLRCHYCGFTMKPPVTCEACGSTRLETKGFGTEKIEEELAIFFPEARIMRMDLDTTRAKHAHRNIINAFEEGGVDVLVGTQMVTKGLDFGNVALVGILHADGMMHYPDFRAWERSYQLMAQVSGRAGRKQKRGLVVIQTHSPSHEIIQYVVNNDYEGMTVSQLRDRQYFHYPPYFRLIEFTLKGKDQDLLQFAADTFAKSLRAHFGDRVLGPKLPPVARVRDEYLRTILIKMERDASSQKVRNIIDSEMTLFRARKDFSKIRIVPDVDPM